MDKTTKMLQAIINGQSSMKQELLKKIDSVEKKVDSLEKKVDDGFAKVNHRIDKIGKQLAYLEDDTPTRDEYDGLEKRVGKLEKRVMQV